MNARSSVCQLMDLPDNILIKIISNLNIKDRLALSNLDKRCNSLVFKEKELLRNLDFSADEGFTSVSDIEKYFENKNTYKHIQNICINNFDPGAANHVLLHYIKRATNLVKIDVTGINFKNIRELGNFLKPLQHVTFLSIDWPNTKSKNDQLSLETIRKSFSRLEQLSVHLDDAGYSKTFVCILQGCQELVTLEIFGRSETIVDQLSASSPWSIEPKILSKLRLVSFCGPSATEVKEHIMTIIPHPEEWKTGIEVDPSSQDEFYLIEKTYEKLLLEIKYIEKIPHLDPWVYFKCKKVLPLACLMAKVFEITALKESKEFCCLSGIKDQEMCVLKVEDAKLLFENDKHEIPYLTLNHQIEQDCDVHLLALAYPGLTELVLSNITKSIDPKKTLRKSNCRKKLSARNVNSSFRKLVENIPKIKMLTIHASRLEEGRVWDLGALCLIAGWKCLTTLCLSCIPIKTGSFLIEIGKQCKHLENLTLTHLGRSSACCYRNKLQKMFSYCLNLKKLSIHQDNIGQVSRIFKSLGNCLESIHITSSGKRSTTVDLIDSICQFYRRSYKLIDIICEINGISYEISTDLMSSSLSDFEDEDALGISDTDSDSDYLDYLDYLDYFSSSDEY